MAHINQVLKRATHPRYINQKQHKKTGSKTYYEIVYKLYLIIITN